MLSGTRNEIHNTKFSLIPLKTKDDFRTWEIVCFNCGQKDLNEFFQLDAYAHSKELLAVTYYLQPIEATEENIFYPVALVSLLNDRVEITREERKKEQRILYYDLKRFVV